jgi:hypothetical protein
MRKIHFFIIFSLLLGQKLYGQTIIFSPDPNQFTTDIQKQFEKHIGNTSKATLSNFSENFKSKLDAESKVQFIELFQYLTKRGLKPIEMYSLITTYQALFNSGSFDFQRAKNLSLYLQKSFQPLAPKKMVEILTQLEGFFANGYLYTSNFNKVRIDDKEWRIGFFETKQDFFEPQPIIKEEKKEEEEDIGWGEQQNIEEYDSWNDPAIAIGASKSLEEVNLPKIQGLHFIFNNTNLHLLSPSDSVTVEETSGAFEVVQGIFIGKNGKVKWSLDKGIPEATLDKFSFKVIGTRFMAEQVLLSFPELLKNEVKGVLEIRLEKRPTGLASSYPRFKSYYNNADLILNLKNYEYKGGLSLVANKMSSASLYDKYTKIVANKGTRNTFEVLSLNFILTDSLITSDRVSFITKLDKDSITHPAVRMRFDLKNNQLNLSKLSKGGFRNSMYSDTFHQVDIKSDAMSWDLNSDKMDFYIIAGNTEVSAVFESFNYYNPDRIRFLSTAAGFNPLIAAGNFIARKKVNKLSVDEMIVVTKKERFQVANGMLIGHQMGFFDFNPNDNSYSLSRKGQHYFLSYMGKTDFDDLVLTSLASNSSKGNASIDLNSKSLDIKGAQDFKLSDSLGISFIPKDQSMQIVGNKVFTFNGEIVVKNFRFFGDFEVQYENFLVQLKRIDSIRFVPLELYKRGSKIEIGGHMIYGKTGVLYLNDPNNKSGRKILPEFPKLEIPGGVLTYFNEPGRKQKYETEVYFKANSLKIDSLNTINPVYAGTFYSDKIFKPISENLLVLPDTTLGIIHKQKGPYKLYGGESTLIANSNIVLNKSGINTSGELSHLAGKLKAKEIKFFEDLLIAKGEEGKISETVTATKQYYPAVQIAAYDTYWQPSLDSMKISSEKGFEFYAGSSLLTGSLVLRTTGLFGDGKLERKDSDAMSNGFKFNKTGFLATNAIFNVKSEEKDAKPVFSGKNVGLDFNVQQSLVKVSSQNSGFNDAKTSVLDFPYSSYSTTIDNALWDIKKKLISMEGALESSVFQSTAPTQFGLKFNGTAASYDIAALNLKISGVEYINSVDASIVPPNGHVAVMKDGKLEEFTNAKIIADTLNKHHVLTSANVKINSKLSYTGNADYQYINVSNDTFNIKLGNFEFAEIDANGNILKSKSSNKLSTIAKAKVSEKDSIYLSPKMLYRGEITMLAPFKNLSLNGSVIPDLQKYPMLGGNWINYSGNKSEEISINVDETLKDGGKPLYVGLHLRAGAANGALYPTFLSAKKAEDDLDVFLAKGIFKRDEPNKKFVIEPVSAAEVGNKYELYDDQGLIALEGKFNLLGAESKIFQTVGIANIGLDSMVYDFNTLMKIEFPMSIPNTQKLGQNIVKSNLDAGNSDPAIVTDSPYMISKLKQFLGNKDTEEYSKKSMREHLPLHKASTKFLSTLVLSDLNLRYNPVANTFHSVGKIGISNIGDVDINAMVDGYLEVVKNPLTGDEFYIFLEISPTNWYYFGYKAGQLGVTSTDEEVNKMFTAPVGAKEKKSEIAFVDVAEASKYRKKFLQMYLGIKEAEFVKKPTSTTTLPNAPKPKTPAKKADEQEGF